MNNLALGDEGLVISEPGLGCMDMSEAHAVHPISTLQTESSLLGRDVEDEICRPCASSTSASSRIAH